MKVTDVRIKLLETNNKIKAIASITFDECFVVHEIKVLDGSNGLFIVMPGKKMDTNEFIDIAHPIKTETRNEIQEAVLKAYKEALSKV